MLRDFRQILVLLGGGAATVAACHGGSSESGSSGSCGSGPCADVATDVSCDGPLDMSDIGCAADCGGQVVVCSPGQKQPCYDGAQPPIDPCFGGERVCLADGTAFAYTCDGEVPPTPDACDTPAAWTCGGAPIACGPAVWAAPLAGSGEEHAVAVALDAAGNAFLAGTTTGGSLKIGSNVITADPGVFLAKVDNQGAPLWLESFAGAGSIALAVDATGAVYATGVFTGTLALPGKTIVGAQKPFAYLAKLGPGGQLVFGREYPTPGFLTPAAIAVTADGDLVLAGSYDGPKVRLGSTTLPASSNSDAFVALLDPSGDPKWVSASSVGANLDAYASVAVDAQKRIFVTGTSNQPGAGCVLSHALFDAYTLDGVRVWSNQAPFGARGAAVVPDGNGGLYATGPSSGIVTADYAVEADGYVVHAGAAGIDWTHPIDFVGEAIALDRTAIVVGGGSVGSSANDLPTAHLVKLEQDGSRHYDHGYGLAPLGASTKPIASIDALAVRADHGVVAFGTVRGQLQLGLGFSNVLVASTTGLDAFVAEIGP